jgi:hypothetical protein
MQSNLGSIFVHNFKFPFIKKFYCFKCKLNNCEICRFLNTDYVIKFKHLSLPILCNSNCSSSRCIYIINCKLCNAFYVGQTGGPIAVRIKQHIKTIKLFTPFSPKNSDSCVSIHFNLHKHTLEHFSFYILKSDILSDDELFYTETFFINFFLKLECKVLNDSIPVLKTFYMQ